jgi:hypothetical protein
MSRIAGLLLLGALCLFLPVAAWAGENRVTDIRNINHEIRHNGTAFTWEALIQENVGSAVGSTRVEIHLGEGLLAPKVGEVPAPAELGWVGMSWFHNVAPVPGEYKFRFDHGTVVWPRSKTTTLNIAPADIPAAPGPAAPPPPGGTGPPAPPGAPIQDKGGLFEQAIAGVINGLVLVMQVLAKVATGGEYRTLGELVFTAGDLNDFMTPAPLTDWWPKLNAWYAGMAPAAAGLCLLTVFLTAFKFMSAGTSGRPDARAEATESMLRWGLAVLFIAAAPIFVRALLLMNSALVASLVGIAQSLNIPAAPTLSTTGLIQSVQTGSVLGTALVKLMFAGLELWLNIIFLVRMWVLAALIVFTPLMAWLWAINKNVRAAAVWMGEVLTNAFLQAAYALGFLLLLTFCDPTPAGMADGGWFTLLVGCLCVVPIAGMLRNSLQGLWAQMSGINEEGIGAKALGVFGLAGLVSLPRVMGASAQNPMAAAGGAMVAGGALAAGGGPALGGTGGAAGGGGGGSLAAVPGTMAGPGIAAGGALMAGGGPAPGGTGSAPGGWGGTGGIGRALDVGRTVGGAAGTVAGGLAAVALAPVPGGPALARGAAGVTASLARFAGSTASLGSQTVSRYRETGSLGQAITQVGGGSPLAAASRAAGYAALDAVAPRSTIRVAEAFGAPLREGAPRPGPPRQPLQYHNEPTSSIDGVRFR